MKTNLLNTTVAILGSLTLLTSGAWAEDKPQILEPDAVLAKPADFAGKTVTVHAAVDRVSPARRMFTLTDPAEAGCADGCAKTFVMAVLPADSRAVLPKQSEEVLVVGQIEAGANPQLRVTEIVTAKEELQRRLQAAK